MNNSMKFIKSIKFIPLLLIIFNITGTAQRLLTIEDALSQALKGSFGIQSAQYNLISSEKSLEAFQRGLMTSVNLELDAPNYSHRLMSNFNPQTGTSEFFEVGFTTVESRLTFSQPVVFTNGNLYLRGNLWRRNQFNSTNQYPADYYSNLIVGLRQPLFAFNSQKANLQRAEINLLKSKRNFTRAEREIIYDVTAAFYRLYQLKQSAQIKREKVKQTESSYSIASNKYKAGLIAEVDALQFEIDLAADRNELLNAERSLNESLDDFKLLIGLDLSENIDITAVLNFQSIEVNKEDAITAALNYRAELLNSEADVTLKEMTLDEVDSKGNVSALLSANYGINKNDDLFRDVFTEFAKDRSVTLTLQVPIIDWGRNKRETEAAKAELDLAKLNYSNQKQQIEKEIIAVINKIESAKARVEVLSKTVELAEKSYSISLARFEAGNITSFDLSQMQLRLTDAKLNSLNALIDYKLALADFARKTGRSI
jgi:outer membrane protein